jgi:uncharacterized protein (UPF0332 family)
VLDLLSLYLSKAAESLAGADSELANGRYNNCANRCYYACFQAAIAALMHEGIQPRGASGEWSHEYVPSQFDGVLIYRRSRYPTTLRGILGQSYTLRQKADYNADDVSQTQAERAVRRCRLFVEAVQSGVRGAR